MAKADGKVGKDGQMTGLSDPFTKVMWNGDVLGQTKPIMDTLNPVWAKHDDSDDLDERTKYVAWIFVRRAWMAARAARAARDVHRPTGHKD